MVPCAFVSRGSMVTRIAGNRSFLIPLLAEEGWRDSLIEAGAPGWSVRLKSSFQTRIVSPFVTDGCGLTVAGDKECVVIERHEASFDSWQDVLVRITPEV